MADAAWWKTQYETAMRDYEWENRKTREEGQKDGACTICHGVFLLNMPVLKKGKAVYHAWCYMWREVKRSDSDSD